ncbi:MAG: AMP-binding protein, partial [bacterium]|nr:AMP-binding protein [bacterium]
MEEKKLYRDTAITVSQSVKEREYWKTKLSGDLQKSIFYYDYEGKNIKIQKGETYEIKKEYDCVEFNLSGDVYSRLMWISNQSDERLHMILVAGVTLLLHAYSGNTDIILASPIYKQEIVGKFINTVLLLRNNLSDQNATFRDLLLQVAQTIDEADENQNYPVDAILFDLNMHMEDGDFPLSDVVVLLENVHDKEHSRHIHPNIFFSFLKTAEFIRVQLEYNTSLYEKSTVKRIAGYFEHLLGSVLFEVDTPVSEVEIIPPAEKEQLLTTFNNTGFQIPEGMTLHGLFEEQAAKTPNNTAIIYEGRHLTYSRLNKKSNRLAGKLREMGVGPGTLVGIMMESLEMPIAILGVLKAGGAYLPISPDYPKRRILSMIKDSAIHTLLTREKIMEDFSYSSIKQIYRGTNAQVVRTLRPPIKDYDGLPIPDITLIDFEKYSDFLGEKLVKNAINIQGTRGCPFHCLYCHKVWSKKHVVRSAENIFKEVELYYNLGIRRFSFIDDIFNLDVKNSSRFFRAVIARGMKLQIHFPNGLRADILTEEYVDLMVEAGTVHMGLALETASPRLQKLINKNLDIGKLWHIMDYIHRTHPHVILQLFTMHGFPTETEEEAMMTLDFVKNFKWLDFPYINILKIYPNTEMETLAVENGLDPKTIRQSDDLAYYDWTDTLPFPRTFTSQYQADFLNNYFLLKERLQDRLPHQMNVMTEEELVQMYKDYLPDDGEINSLDDLLDLVGLKRDQLSVTECVDPGYGVVPDFNEKAKAHFPEKEETADGSPLRILLLDLSQTFEKGGDRIFERIEAPLGLMSLMTYLNREFGGKVEGKIAKPVIDFSSYKELKELIDEFDPQLIGVRSLNFYKDFVHKSIGYLRQWKPDVPVILGGPYATSSYERVLNDSNIDIAVIGEGEYTLAELVGEIIKNDGKLPPEETLSKIKGLAYAEKRSAARRAGPEIFFMDNSDETLASYSSENPVPVNEPGNPAYVVYTSGSTGRPKGVPVAHCSVVNTLLCRKDNYKMTTRDTALHLFSFSFDGFVTSFFTPLISGARLIFAGEKGIKDVMHIKKLLDENNVTHFISVPALYQAILETFTDGEACTLKVVTLAGDKLLPAVLEKSKQKIKGLEIAQEYGVSEASVMSTIQRHQEKDALLKIGTPIWNTGIYILDERDGLKPIGVPGELCISGAGVAPGYLNRPELTAERFANNLPISSSPEGNFQVPGRLYRTGDLARWLPDGSIQFIGRSDFQVKVRGIRMELGEIENRLLEHEAVKEAVVVPREVEEGNVDLSAYYVLGTPGEKQAELWPSVAEFYIYDDLLYYAMTNDERRNNSYKVAIRRHVKDKVVMEVGTGKDAVLARFCVEAGARKVYALELLETTYNKAKETIKRHGLEEKIILIHGDATKVELPEKADVCVSEIVGSIGGSEGATVILNKVRRLLKEDGIMIPEKSITKIAAASLPDEIHNNPGFTHIPSEYVDKVFDSVGYRFDLRLCIKNFDRSLVLSNAQDFENLDFSTIVPEESRHDIDFTIHKDSRLDGFVVWLNLHTAEDEIIDILEYEYCWLPVFVPVFYPGITVSKGDVIKGECIRTMDANALNCDFKIKGVLVKSDGENVPFDHDLPHFEKKYMDSPFYRKLFSRDSLVKIDESSAKPTASQLKDFLAEQLPNYMIPSHLKEMEMLPLNRSGKIDREALPKPEANTEGGYFVPDDEIEDRLGDIWAEVLGVEKETIGADTNFFKWGGHSLKATILTARIHKEFQVKVPLAQIFKTPGIRELGGFIKQTEKETGISIKAAKKKELYPLSSVQKRIYMLQNLDTNSTAYNTPVFVILKGELDEMKFRAVFDTLLERHESLRTSFELRRDEPLQRIHENVEFDIMRFDQAPAPDSRQGNAASQSEIKAAAKRFVRPFDLADVPLMRVGLLQIDRSSHLFMVDMHHIICDGTSLGILVKEFMALYKGEKLPPLEMQYKDFSEWRNSGKMRKAIEEQEVYWLKRFEEAVPIIDLPRDFARPEIRSFEGGTIEYNVKETETAALKELAREEGATLFMVLLAVFNIFTAKISGQEDIVVGTPVAGRGHADLQSIIGMFVNTLPLRNRPEGHKTIREFLRELKEDTLEAFDNQDYPFEDLVTKTAAKRDTSRNPLFDVMFALEIPGVAEMEIPGLKLEPYEYNVDTTKFDLILQGSETGNELSFICGYSSKLFKKSTIERFNDYFKKVVSAVAEEPGRKISSLQIISSQEKQHILQDFNDTAVSYPGNKTIHQCFEDQVEKTPSAVAITYGRTLAQDEEAHTAGSDGEAVSETFPGKRETDITYGELNTRSNQLARVLMEMGVTAGTIVGIMMERSPAMIFGLLGIMKAGGTYLPIEPGSPSKRIQFQLEDGNVGILVIKTAGYGKFDIPGIKTVDMLELENQPPVPADEVNPDHRSGPSDSAYIIYTSGTTGRPKGVVVEHRSAVNTLMCRKEEYKQGLGDTSLQLFSYVFDGFVTSFFTPVLSGARVILVCEDEVKDIALLSRIIDNGGVTHLISVPSLFLPIIDTLSAESASRLKIVTLAGDKLPVRILQAARQKNPTLEISNEYGVTEGSVMSTIYRHQEKDNTAKVGKPAGNVKIY